MATYYVRKTGNDLNAGTSPDQAWQTLAKAFGASGIGDGDTLYIGGGIYRETVTCSLLPTQRTTVIGDPTGAFTGDAEPVIWTSYTTDDRTAGSSASPFTWGASHLQIENIIFVPYTSHGCVLGNGTAGRGLDIVVRGCVFYSQNGASSDGLRVIVSEGGANHVIEDCIFFGVGASHCAGVLLQTHASAHYDSGVQVRNCLFMCGRDGLGLAIRSSGADTGFYGGGVDVYNCTAIGHAGVWCETALHNTLYPSTVQNCIIMAGNWFGIDFPNVTGAATEDFNVIVTSGTARRNVAAGANTFTGNQCALPLHLGEDWFQGRGARPWLMPYRTPILGFGNGTNSVADDMLGVPRPAGGQIAKAIGCYEYSPSGAREATVKRSGNFALRIDGPGVHTFDVPVNPQPTTISVYARYNAAHGTTNKPQMVLLANEGIGVAEQSATMTAVADMWEQLSVTFTPTMPGVVKVRFVSRSAATNGAAFFDDFGLT